MIATIDVGGKVTRTYYDTLNRPQFMVQNLTNWGIGETSPPPEYLRTVEENLTTETVYDLNGNIIATIGPDGVIDRTYYDELNRPILAVQNVASSWIYTDEMPTCNRDDGADSYICTETIYDPNGNVIATIDPAARITRTYYDELNRPQYIVQNLSNWDVYTDTLPVENLRTNSENLVTETVYNDDGQVIEVTPIPETLKLMEKDLLVKSTTEQSGASQPPANQTWRSYYFTGAQRVAVRVQGGDGNDDIYFLLADHLGSTSLTVDAEGNKVAEMLYGPWGEVRYEWGSQVTAYTYTGQRGDMMDDFGLMYYGARWFDPALGRWSQADTIIPNPGSILDWDRYSYVRANPLKFNDPSGRNPCYGIGDPATREACSSGYNANIDYSNTDYWVGKVKTRYGVTLSNDGIKDWTLFNARRIFYSLVSIDFSLNGHLRSIAVSGDVSFNMGEYVPTPENCPKGGCTYSGWTRGCKITFNTMGNAAIRQMNIYHEFGHVLDNSPGMVNEFSSDLGINSSDFITEKGYLDRNALTSNSVYEYYDAIQHPYSILEDPTKGAEEHWADIFANYVAGNIDLSEPTGPGLAMYNFIIGALRPYIGIP